MPRYRIPKLTTMPAEVWDTLDALCEHNGLSRGAMIEELVLREAGRKRRLAVAKKARAR